MAAKLASIGHCSGASRDSSIKTASQSAPADSSFSRYLVQSTDNGESFIGAYSSAGTLVPCSSDRCAPALYHPAALAELASAQLQKSCSPNAAHPSTWKSGAVSLFRLQKGYAGVVTIWFFGCRSGDACAYLHVAPGSAAPAPVQADVSGSVNSEATVPTKKDNRPENGSRTTVPKPVSKAQKESPRNFQIGQLRRRFHPKEEQDAAGNTTFAFGMAPTDPDFPFDMTELLCSLQVPHDWPSGAARVKLRATNADMPKGFQLNVERGFDGLVDAAIKDRRPLTLLGLMNSLDRNLERFLTAEKAPTIKLVANARSPQPDVPPISVPQKQGNVQPQYTTRIVPVSPRVLYSAEDRAEAKKTRDSETRQLEARLNRLPLYKKLGDGFSYIVPVTPAKPERLAASLRAVKTVKLSVPSLYPLEKSSIELQAVDANDARAVEAGFQTTENIHQTPSSQVVAEVDIEATKNQIDSSIDIDRPHIKVIPRPPEWSMPTTGQDADSDTTPDHSSDSYEEDEDEDGEHDGGALIPETTTLSSSANTNAPARGTALNLPGLELYGIELLEVKSLSITVKCNRCKEHTDIKNIKATDDPSQPFPVKVDSCRKCANSFNIGISLFPSQSYTIYFPTDVLGMLSPVSSSRCCHYFKISEVKFMVVGLSALSHHRLAAPRKKIRENLGITSGQELPRRGRCGHYGKSYRWFRFSCCAKVFPCDKCHDAATDHPNEHANRMICGFCSREQHYRPETCGICKNVLVGKAGSGFWEGGKGTRDKVKMSRKDPRKYKRA
ncbi:hypothetical protein UA08_08530 [Talaromyces atroroseus]|uniref:CHY-type domain-containing protein n=1 Tax=Talaromyces atroroseus TaxID=1441469 RepID=A0A1Q5Q877_TALAT|nr:hypothetical protein UA08_08530 [Talaromyces atroroseus]OKL56354.1 hypothetical protein UA08_08530 [Talaromyces atroroseus]